MMSLIDMYRINNITGRCVLDSDVTDTCVLDSEVAGRCVLDK